ncbi:eukaryotic translation initiation factor 3 subunit M-like isoform X2 [Solanum pennellii]|uniref:Eukaryotic translation initiation factor 3 subunit M-like isoform X2 n=1 Tax=Solanum pennellii TaxID=28526 RepID=A0ABM1UYT8_SOLPN|nr:eukaryotic translation initiation factor 3 subunit M-like isoform X2 [Solanum pennellii]
MRLLTLVDLGKTKPGQIPYSMIEDTLKIDDIEVESWAVKAISAKLLICKIDQMNQTMYIVCIWDKSAAIASSKACDLERKYC